MRNTTKITAVAVAAGALTLGSTACGSGSDSRQVPTTNAPLVVAATPSRTPRSSTTSRTTWRRRPASSWRSRSSPTTSRRTRPPRTAPSTPTTSSTSRTSTTSTRRTAPHIVPVVPRCTWSRSASTPRRSRSSADLKTGATVALPNDTTNEARALALLADQRPHHAQGRRRPRGDPAGRRQEPEGPQVQGARGRPDAALPRRRRRRGDQRQLRHRTPTSSPPRTPSPWRSREEQPVRNFLAVKKGNENDPRVRSSPSC